jgi:SAM-dependent MidA family methyltransferase
MTYRGHRSDGAPDAPYSDVGERDITAHVDTTTLRRLLEERGILVFGETTQAELLVGCGLEDVLQRAQEQLRDPATWLNLRSAARRLLDPRHLGAFRAVLAGRGLAAEPPLRGLSFRVPGRPG